MKAKGSPFFIMLALGLALFGWVRSSLFTIPKPQLTLVHWPGDGRQPRYYEIADSSKIKVFGSCIQFESIQGAQESFCGNYKVLAESKEKRQASPWMPSFGPGLIDSPNQVVPEALPTKTALLPAGNP
ncbi:hypothetical protein [Cesiribacter sp. SM1]|uniref:hypothetical protein n=1 Tax=Cesiribacter sp. SM1 TaxID=2861196 RepID=UPI001CD7A8CE|nr:hypothetical protein [Cesiribacter sp. SM1]